MDLSNSVILPREDFIELQTAAWDQHTTLGDRLAGTLQTAMFCTILVTAVTAGSWGWAKAMDWKDQQSYDRKHGLLDAQRSRKK